MHSPARGLCKIGVSACPSRRFRETRIERDLPDLNLNFVCVAPPGADDLDVERLAHLLLSRRWAFAQEWFRCGPETGERAVLVASNLLRRPAILVRVLAAMRQRRR